MSACCVSTDLDSSIRTLELARQSRLVLPFVGMHPDSAQDDPKVVEELASERRNEIVGIGEIGLDGTPPHGAEQIQQRAVFERMMGMAERFGRPVSVHSRRALDDVLDTVPSFGVKAVLLHWFDGSKRHLARAMDLDCYVSYGPVSVYASDKRSLIARTRSDRILAETDGPVQFSRCFGGRSAQVGFLPSVVLCIAGALKVSYCEASLLLERNTERFLALERRADSVAAP